MRERLLHFVWQMQYYNKGTLLTDQEEPLVIIHPGQMNPNQGPDFLDAHIKIGDTTWVGNIEIHVNASHWKFHQHDDDVHYQNVILHVVWENDYEVKYKSGHPIPILSLNNRVSKLLLGQYEFLMNSPTHIPCAGFLSTVSDLVWSSWKTRLVAEKLERKTSVIALYLRQSNQNWETVFWWMLARNFGVSVNKNNFEMIARSIPVSVLARHKTQIHQLECFLFGQAGLLDTNFEEDYPIMLQKEYRFYKKKYSFAPVHAPPKFHRIRPNNFPTIRLAQLAMLIHQSSHLFSRFTEAQSLKEVKQLLFVNANDYWYYHYVFDQKTSFKKKPMGAQMINNIIINTVIPMLFAYGHLEAKPAYKTKALSWIEETTAETNSILKEWESLGVANNTAFHSQALTELTMQYCLQKKCLSCAIGSHVLKRSSS